MRRSASTQCLHGEPQTRGNRRVSLLPTVWLVPTMPITDCFLSCLSPQRSPLLETPHKVHGILQSGCCEQGVLSCLALVYYLPRASPASCSKTELPLAVLSSTNGSPPRPFSSHSSRSLFSHRVPARLDPTKQPEGSPVLSYRATTPPTSSDRTGSPHTLQRRKEGAARRDPAAFRIVLWVAVEARLQAKGPRPPRGTHRAIGLTPEPGQELAWKA